MFALAALANASGDMHPTLSLAASALDYASKHDLHALVIGQRQRIVDEAYGDGVDGETGHRPV